MKKLLTLMETFEKRNNISIFITLCSDGSSEVKEFWDEEVLSEPANEDELINFLTNISYELDENGRCFSPVVLKKEAQPDFVDLEYERLTQEWQQIIKEEPK